MAKKAKKKRSPIGHYPMTREADTQMVYDEFGRRLQRAMVMKGWSQSELARRANDLLPTAADGQKQGKDFRRDLVSHYIRGQHLPSPANLSALAKALDVEPSDLLPEGGLPNGSAPPLAAKVLPDGRVSLRLRRTVSAETAMKIIKLLQTEDH